MDPIQIDKQLNQKNNLFLAGMVVSMFLWGMSWASGKVLGSYSNPQTISLFRFALTFTTLVLLLILKKEELTIARIGWWYLLAASLCMAVYNLLFFKGIALGKAGAGGVLVTTLNPVLAYTLNLLINRRLPTRKETAGISLGIIAGCIQLRVWDSGNLFLVSGNFCFVLAALTWSVLSIFTSTSSRFGSPLSFSLWLYGICFILMLPFVDVADSMQVLKLADAYFWYNLFFTAVITTALATTFYFVATAKIGASRASSFIFLVPFSAALGSWIFLNEVPKITTIAGGSLGILAVYVLNKNNLH